MLKNPREIFCVTVSGEFKLFGFMRILSGIKFREVFVPRCIQNKIEETGPASGAARRWWKDNFLPMMVKGGRIHFEGEDFKVVKEKTAKPKEKGGVVELVGKKESV